MIVAGAKMHVEAHDLASRRATSEILHGSSVNKAKDDLKAPACSAAAPSGYCVLVEPRLQFDQCRDGLTGLGGITRAATIAESSEVRYSVCLIAITFGSSAACRRNCTTTSKDSYG